MNKRKKHDNHRCDRGSYLPDTEEIAAACAEIQAGWPESHLTTRLRVDWRPSVGDIPETTEEDMNLRNRGGEPLWLMR